MSVVINPGGSGGGGSATTQGTAVINPRDWTYTAGDYLPNSGELVLTPPTTFSAPTTLTSGSPGTGRTFYNGARLSAGSIASGDLTLTSDTTTTIYNSGTKTALKLDRDYGASNSPSCRMFLVQRLTITAGTNNLEGISSFADEGGTSVNFARVGVTSDGSGGYECDMKSRLSTASATVSQSTIWVANEVHGQRGAVWYADSDSATRPTSGWTRGFTDATLYSSDTSINFGQIVVSKGDNVTGVSSFMGLYVVPQILAPDETVFPVSDEHLVYYWTADLFDTSGPVASAQVSIPSGATITDATIRAALQDAAHMAPSSITARARIGSSPSGSYYALGAGEQESAGDGDLYIDIKMTSDGTYPVSIRPVIIPTS